MKNHKKSSIFSIILVITLLVVSFLLYVKSNEVKELERQNIAEATIQLPRDAIKLSGCVPFMGEHWAVPEDLPFGPTYLVNNNQVIGIEYMFRMNEIPGEFLANADSVTAQHHLQENNLGLSDIVEHTFTFPLSNLKYKFAALDWSAPHAGFVEPHFDMHFYLIDKEEAKTVCPDSTLLDVQSPELEQMLQENSVPYIPLPQDQ